jgi:hypothetical protein
MYVASAQREIALVDKVGFASTVPLTSVVTSEAPVDIAEMVPELIPNVADEFNLTYNV